MTHFFTTDPVWFSKWDEYISKEPRGNHLVLTDWLASYKSYGFDFELCVFLDGDTIVGGYGAVIAKAMWFKFYIIPHGPICTKGYEYLLSDCLKYLKKRAKKLKCCYVQFSMPLSSIQVISSHVLSPNVLEIPKGDFNKGKLFNYIYCSYGINWVDFKECKSPEELLNQISAKTRRNIRLAHRLGVDMLMVEQEQDIKEGYKLVEDKAQQGKYALRDFDDLKNQLLALISKDKAHFMLLKHDSEIKGASFSVRAGNYFTNIFGGTKIGKPDVKAGYALHWQWIVKSFEMGFKGYNISMGGSKGVREFKAHLGAQEIFYDNPHHYSILNPIMFKVYVRCAKLLKGNKAIIAGILKRFK
ncbi:lipid II:glycine glycyltransferase FemX [Hanstruepera marina]|uniref:lipid II:glycine glycyltransferase FemX n=1 Tax=Hanstruepera marina TaxID=2873265 RepID=UPI001CA7AC55|nr:GNAT family N-acetyltransferase [Hanstruepera marina]